MSNETEMVKPQMQQKMDVVKGIQERIEKSNAFYIAKYDGVNVESITELRRELRKAGSELNVLKNKLFKRAIADQEWASNFDELLTGPNATAFAYEDGSIAAKILFDFAKKNKALQIKGCLFDGQYFGPDKISIIKDLPTKEQLLGMVASVINEPMAKVARTLDALREQKEQ
ncbi:MAG: 50S ribosomal protein L10 [Candidatus Cloacimonadota bacterium]|nr:MAG: 50S ribosomal protein L10 [Candidatus Cloacimonadota bacterium]PIE78180.1 MAG: 50S ribosomal protein L10 [Candidatus Delongbacteria bacterium]